MAEEKHKLFVGSLPPDTTQDELRIVFGTYGNPTDIHIMQGKSNSGQSCAFVVFDTRNSAENAIASLDGVYSLREASDPPIRVSWAKQSGGGGPPPVQAPQYVSHQVHHHQPRHVSSAPPVMVSGGGLRQVAGGRFPGAATGAFSPARLRGDQPRPLFRAGLGGCGGIGSVPPPPPPDPAIMMQKRVKLFVGNLPSDICNEAVNMVFSHYGTVTNIHIMVGKAKSGQSCAFVEYAGAIEAETAILTLHDKYEIRKGEGPILVKYANSQARSAPY